MKKNLVQYIKEIRDKMENLEESQKSYTDEKTLIAFRGEAGTGSTAQDTGSSIRANVL